MTAIGPAFDRLTNSETEIYNFLGQQEITLEDFIVQIEEHLAVLKTTINESNLASRKKDDYLSKIENIQTKLNNIKPQSMLAKSVDSVVSVFRKWF